MGTQKDEGKFGTKIQPKVMITWELPTEMHTFKEEKGPEPFVVSKEYTLNLGEKSNLRKDLESWRGRAFTEEELKGFNIGKLIGAPCLISVIHQTKPSGVYARVSTIAPMVKGMQCPPAVLTPIVYDVDSGRNEVFNSLPDWIKNKIQQCLNWQTPEPEPQGSTELHDEEQSFSGNDEPF